MSYLYDCYILAGLIALLSLILIFCCTREYFGGMSHIPEVLAALIIGFAVFVALVWVGRWRV